MQLSQNLLNQVRQIAREVASQSGHSDFTPVITFNYNGFNSGLASRIHLLKIVSLGLLAILLILVLFVTIFYFRVQDEEAQLTEEDLERMILEKVNQELKEKKMVIMPNQALKVLYRVNSDDNLGNEQKELFLTSQSSQETSEQVNHEPEIQRSNVFNQQGLSRSDNTEFDDCRAEDRTEEASTNIQTKDYAEKFREELSIQIEDSDLLSRGLKELSGKISSSCSESE